MIILFNHLYYFFKNVTHWKLSPFILCHLSLPTYSNTCTDVHIAHIKMILVFNTYCTSISSLLLRQEALVVAL